MPDPVGGSGAALIACERTGRQARLVGLDPKYVDVIVQRWQEFARQATPREDGGLTFAEVAARRGVPERPHEDTALRRPEQHLLEYGIPGRVVEDELALFAGQQTGPWLNLVNFGVLEGLYLGAGGNREDKGTQGRETAE